MTTFKPSPQQSGYFNWIDNDEGSAVLEAVAGSGKTTTLIQGLKRMHGSVFFGAYNKKIAAEIKNKVPADMPNLTVATMHSAGFKNWTRVARAVKVDENKCRTLFRESSDKYPEYKPFEKAVLELVSYAKQSAVGLLKQEDRRSTWESLIDHFDVEIPEEPVVFINGSKTPADNFVLTINLARKLLQKSIQLDYETIDFDDMIYAPLIHRINLRKYDWVMIDECFLGDTPILLDTKGNWAPISQLVETSYRGKVLSYDEQSGKTVLRRVTGHKRIIRNKPMVQLRFMQKNHEQWTTAVSRRVHLGVPIVVCTEDHKVRTPKGWIEASRLRPGDTVYMETAQGRITAYQHRHKISAAGKANLAPLGNKRGLGNRGGSRKHFNSIKGGNGRVSAHELLFAVKMRSLLPSLQHEGIIATGGRKWGLPTHFKVDFFLSDQPVIIEIDGKSHNSPERKEQDKRKDAWLADQDYTVIRFTNAEVAALTPDQILERIFPRCFVEAEIIEVNDYVTKDTYVYDLEVEDTHCYFAHGLLVHNCQDTNAARRLLALGMMKPTSRMVSVGDRNQAIYAFQGADHNAIDLIAEAVKAKRLPLTVSYRCPKAVIKYAQQWVTDIESHPKAQEGKVTTLDHTQLVKSAVPGDAVLCRFNAPLVTNAFAFIAAGIPAVVEGRDIGKGLIELATRWKVKSFDTLEQRLEKFLERETAKYRAKEQESRAAGIEDKVQCLRVLIGRVRSKEGNAIDLLVAEINGLFGDTTNGQAKDVVLFSSIHKSKGREWNRVFWLQTGPSGYAKMDWEKEQERNLCYVATTRAKAELINIPLPKEPKL